MRKKERGYALVGKYYNNRPTSKLEQIRDSAVKIHDRIDPGHDIISHDEGEPGYYNDRPKTKLETIRDAAECIAQITENPTDEYQYEELRNVDVASFVSQVTAAIKKLTVGIEPVQSGSGDPSPSNVRPITGWTGANIYVSPTDDPADGRTYSVAFPTEAGTVYGGTLDVTSGVLTVDRAMLDLGSLSWTGWTESGTIIFHAIATGKVQLRRSELLCSQYKPNYNVSVWADLLDFEITGAANERIYIRDSRYSTVAAFAAAVSGVQLVYELATPVTYQLTPQQITTLLGENNVWADTGEIVHIKYPYAEI